MSLLRIQEENLNTIKRGNKRCQRKHSRVETCARELKYYYKGSSPKWGSAYVNGDLSNKQPDDRSWGTRKEITH